MGEALIMRRGGNGTKLRVYAYATTGALPATARAGDIAIITSTAIGQVRYSGTQPSAPGAGDIWINGASLSPVSVVLKANPLIEIYPMVAKQYSGSAWVIKPIYVYASAAWVAAGTMWLWGYSQNAVETEAAAGSASYVSGNIVYMGSAPGAAPSYAGVRSYSPVSLTGSKKIVATFASGELGRYRQIVVTTGTAWNSGVIASVTLNNATSGMVLTLDTSTLTGSYYIHVVAYYPTNPANTVVYNLSELKVVYSE